MIFPGFYEASGNLGSQPPEWDQPRRSLSSPWVFLLVLRRPVYRSSGPGHRCLRNRAVTVFVVSATTVCVCAPASDQSRKEYVQRPSVCGDGAVTVFDE